jgi:putative ABC transport system ATP-binding protein
MTADLSDLRGRSGHNMLTTMLQLNNIEKYYRQGLQKTWILKNVNLTVAQGEFLTIMGPSGAGKSTLLQIIGMLDQADSGEYHFLEEPVHQFNEKKRTDLYKHYIGFVFQAYHLIDDLTVYENIETPLIYRGVKNSERKGLVAELLDRFNMVAKKDLFPNQLSGGQQQLVGIARAIIGKPKLLLADEPTGNLHTKQAEEIMELFAQLHREGMTIIQVTHSERNATYGDRVIQLEDGFVRQDYVVEPSETLRDE